MDVICDFDALEKQLRSSVGSAPADGGDRCYQEYRAYESRGLEDALSALRRLAGKGCNRAFICQALKQRYLRWLDAGRWADPAAFKKGMAFSVGYYRLVHELEKAGASQSGT